MYDVQVSFVRDVILGQVTLPDTERREQDIHQWQRREEQLKPNDGESEFYYQIEYMRDLLNQCHSPPQFDIDRIISGVKELIQHKQENIFTYRDHAFASIVTGKRAPDMTNRLPWLQNKADSIEEFFELEIPEKNYNSSNEQVREEPHVKNRSIQLH